MVVWIAEERVCWARSQAVRRRQSAWGLEEMLEFLDEVVDETVIEIHATKVSVTSSSLDFENTLLDCHDRDIGRSSTKTKDEDVALADTRLAETVGDGGSGGLVDDTEHLETGDCSGVLGGLALSVVEVCN